MTNENRIKQTDITTLANSLWARQSSFYEMLKGLGNWGEDPLIQRHLGNLRRAGIPFDSIFESKDLTARCIDERTPGKISVAGGGALLTPDALEFFLQTSGAQAVSSHEECGAAKAIYPNNLVTPTQEQINHFASAKASEIAQSAGIPHIGTLRFRPDENPDLRMEGFPGFHHALGVIYDETGDVDSGLISRLHEGTDQLTQAQIFPDMFKVSAAFHLNPEDAKFEAEFAINLMLGDHGFGNRFTPTTPVIVVPVAKSGNLRELTNRLQPLAKPYNGRVVISGFEKP